MTTIRFRSIGYSESVDDLSEAVAQGVVKAVGGIEEVYDRLVVRARAIRESGDFTREGARKQLAALADEARTGFAEIERDADGYVKNASAIEQRIQPVAPRGEDALLLYMKQQEIRATLRALDPVERIAAYREAARRGDDLLAGAIELDPARGVAKHPLVPEAEIDALREQRLAGRYPEEAARLQELRKAHREVLAALESARRELRKLGLDLRQGAIREQARASGD